MGDIVLKKKDGGLVKAQFKVLDESYIGKIMELEKEIVEDLEDKNFYANSDRESFLDCIKNKGKIVGCVAYDGELAAMGVYVEHGYEDHNYGYDLGIEGEKLLTVCQIESTVVRKAYRGNNLQYKICDILEQIARDENKRIVAATVAPENRFSLETFKRRGYSIEMEKIKYGSYNRYILKKEI